MRGEINDPERENAGSNWASKRLGLDPEMRNSNSGLHLISLCNVKLRTQYNKFRMQSFPESSLDSAGEEVAYPQLQAPDVPAENIPMPILPPKKHLTYRMAGEGSSRKGTKLPCRRSQWIAALHHAKSQASEEHEVSAFSSDSEQEKDGNLEADAEGALLVVEGGADEILPKNDVYDALWAMLDVESENEAEEIPGQWDLDSFLNNWGKIESNMGPVGNDQGPPPVANKASYYYPLAKRTVQFLSVGRKVFCDDGNTKVKRSTFSKLFVTFTI
ncbi:hypothetical protein PIB30_055782 [Stylosanthes scabra]|uniref:Uncharacterized protein n=1 Tax=Stylosanthes scabra TaxID=79078 RepID=A0ABU6YJP4_9FABA|nr:hypothetical protein [Stylosanthes scabra]